MEPEQMNNYENAEREEDLVEKKAVEGLNFIVENWEQDKLTRTLDSNLANACWIDPETYHKIENMSSNEQLKLISALATSASERVNGWRKVEEPYWWLDAKSAFYGQWHPIFRWNV